MVSSQLFKIAHLTSNRFSREVRTMKLKFFKQMSCRHLWKKDASFYQLNKDDDKTQWICIKCKLHVLRNRWNPPEQSQCQH